MVNERTLYRIGLLSSLPPREGLVTTLLLPLLNLGVGLLYIVCFFGFVFALIALPLSFNLGAVRELPGAKALGLRAPMYDSLNGWGVAPGPGGVGSEPWIRVEGVWKVRTAYGFLALVSAAGLWLGWLWRRSQAKRVRSIYDRWFDSLSVTERLAYHAAPRADSVDDLKDLVALPSDKLKLACRAAPWAESIDDLRDLIDLPSEELEEELKDREEKAHRDAQESARQEREARSAARQERQIMNEKARAAHEKASREGGGWSTRG